MSAPGPDSQEQQLSIKISFQVFSILPYIDKNNLYFTECGH